MTRGIKKFYFVFVIVLCLLVSLTSCKKKCEHEYDNACDSTCNLCEEVRDVGEHEFNSADCINAKTCKFCGVTEGEPLGHSPAEDDGDCTTPIKCKICEEVVIKAIEHDFSGNYIYDNTQHWNVCQNDGCLEISEKVNHTPEEDDGDCTTFIRCTICDEILNNVLEHDFSGNFVHDESGHWKVCQNDNCNVTSEKINHTPKEDDGDCTTDILCTSCDEILIKGLEHDFSGNFVHDESGHWKVCQNDNCNVTSEKINHTPKEDDGDCTTDILCTECEEVLIKGLEHNFSGNFVYDETSHWKVCQNDNCEKYDVKTDHTPVLDEGICEHCEYKYDYIYDQNTNNFTVFTAQGLYSWSEYYSFGYNLVLANDITLPSELIFDADNDGVNDSNWDAPSVSGVIEGNGYSIKGLIMRPKSSSNSLGFISDLLENSVVKNLRIENANIRFSGINCGILVSYNDGHIENCSVSGVLEVEGNNVGGITGTNSGTIIACYNEAKIYASDGVLGGIVGQNGIDASIIGCYNTGTISGSDSVGGIVGAYYYGQVVASYSTGKIVAEDSSNLVIGYKNSSLPFDSIYAQVNLENSDVVGVEYCKVIDNEIITWSIAKEEMNKALEDAGYMWRYIDNNNSDATIAPLLLSNN